MSRLYFFLFGLICAIFLSSGIVGCKTSTIAKPKIQKVVKKKRDRGPKNFGLYTPKPGDARIIERGNQSRYSPALDAW